MNEPHFNQIMMIGAPNVVNGPEPAHTINPEFFPVNNLVVAPKYFRNHTLHHSHSVLISLGAIVGLLVVMIVLDELFNGSRWFRR